MKRKGFTIIELMLAMGFLGTLLVTIALLVTMITGIYQKGLSLRAVNANGKQIIDDMTRIISGSPMPGVSLNPTPDISGEITNTAIHDALKQYFVTTVKEGQQLHGAFCTGSFSYIWNTQPSYSSEEGLLRIEFPENSSSPLDNPHTPKFARIPDSTRSVCRTLADPGKVSISGVTTIEATGTPIELINNDESDLILYDFVVFPATQNDTTSQIFYSVTFILATLRGGVNILSNGDYCDVNSGHSVSGLSHDFNYCAVNKFNFAIRATGYTEAGN